MLTYANGSGVLVSLPFADESGNPVTPTALSVSVVDENGAVLLDPTPIDMPTVDEDDPAPTSVNYQVSATVNTLAGDATVGARRVILAMTVGGNTITSSAIYLLLVSRRLELLKNSFQTHDQALVVAATLPRVPNVASASSDDFQAAMGEAFRRLTNLGYRIRRPEDMDRMSYFVIDDEQVVDPRYWPLMTLEEWLILPERFRQALCRAQVVEANAILQQGGPGERRNLGLMSESVGESSMMFRPGKPLDLGISSEALNQLTGYLDMRVTTTRA